MRGNTLEIMGKPIERIIYGLLDIKLGQFTEQKCDAVLKKKN